jgi:hypothetical protein
MNKFYSTILSIFIVVCVIGQNSSSTANVLPITGEKIDKNSIVNHQSNRANPFWTEDFNGGLTTSNGTWTSTGIWKYSFYTTSGAYSGSTPAFASTSAANGFMLFDTDSANADFSSGTPVMIASPIGLSGELVSPVIDLSLQSTALLTFAQDFRWCCTGTLQLELAVSVDGGTTWGIPYDLTFGVGVNENFGNTNLNGIFCSVNISDQAANQSNVKLKFSWIADGTANSHYFWTIDDIGLESLPGNDISNTASWVFGESTNFAEYGRTPLSQLDQNWVIGSQVSNIGDLDQTNVTLNVDFGSFSASAIYDEDGDGNADVLSKDSTRSIQTVVSPTLNTGVYTGTYTLSSDGDQAGGDNFGNNVLQRSFEVTNDVYSLDGIGNHPGGVQSLEAFGTSSFYAASGAPDIASDGIAYGTHYPFQNTDTINSVTALISSTTLEYAQVILYIIDSTDFIDGNFGNAIFASSNPYDVTQADVANGFITLPVDDGSGLGYMEIPPGSYYVALELYSAGNTYDIRILSDKTVTQPFFSSMVWIPGLQAYTNPNACAIRLNLGLVNTTGIKENTENISVFPNPSNGLVNIELENGLNTNVIIRDIAGKIIQELNINSNTSVDLNTHGKGVYLFEINSGENTIIRKVTIQ